MRRNVKNKLVHQFETLNLEICVIFNLKNLLTKKMKKCQLKNHSKIVKPSNYLLHHQRPFVIAIKFQIELCANKKKTLIEMKMKN